MSRITNLAVSLSLLMLLSVFMHLLTDLNFVALDHDDNLPHSTTANVPTVELYQPEDPVQQIEVSGKGRFSCYLLSTGGLYCWGDNSVGQLGDGTTTDRRLPTAPAGLQSNVSMVALGQSFGCALMDNGTVNCWGKNNIGQLGVGDLTDRMTPIQTNSFGTNKYAVSISAGDSHVCAIINDGTIKCWGDGSYGRLGSSSSGSSSPISTSSLGTGRTAVSISLGGGHSCALLDDNSVKCWGTNLNGQVGVGSFSQGISSPITVSSFGTNRFATSITSGGQHSCAILNDGNASCWGYNDYGQLGLNSSSSSRTPQIMDISNLQGAFRSLSAGNLFTCGVSDTNTSMCWGQNSQGTVGDGTTTERSLPVNVSNLSAGDEVLNVSAGKYHTCASFFDGSVRCWGDNTDEALGITFSTHNIRLTPSGRPIGPKSLALTTEVVENQSASLLVRTLYHDGTNISFDYPLGMNLTTGGLVLSGSPLYTLQSSWNATSNSSNSFATTYSLEVLRDTDGDGMANKYDSDDDGDQIADDSDVCPIEWGNATVDRRGCPDTDGDGVSNSGDAFPVDKSQTRDTDQDGFGDNIIGFRGDQCPTVYGESRRGGVFGCPDADFDGWDDGNDSFPQQSSQWNDTDGDGFGDEFSGYEGDACLNAAGNSTIDRFGCVDSDGDGYSDFADAFDNNPTQYLDSDGDGYGNNQSTGATQSDAFPSDGTQWDDTDGDGHGDNKYGTQGDHFPTDPNRWQDTDEDGYANEDDVFVNDATQWNDTDGDGYGDNPNGTRPDAFPTDNTEWSDIDGDGVGDNSDVFRFDGSQWADRDGDGYGDNANGTNADAFPDDPTRWSDSDKDGIADEDDDFANDPTQSTDSDNDGYGDDPNGSNPDAFPDDPTEWRDGDGDGYGDNSDAFPVDATQWADTDKDGYGDNKYGSQGDHFPNDATRWKDSDEDGIADEDDAFVNDPTQTADRDGDGYGDNESGTNPDRFPDDGTEWEDRDNDGVGDNADAFVFDPTQSSDSDADGYGDNQTGSNGDAFPNNPLRWADTDKDGYADQDDVFPNDNTQWDDTDGDGYGNNANGTNPDAFPDDATQHADRDGDGFGDNPLGTNADAFPSDTTQWSDQDGDGYGDNPTGQQPDQFPENPTQYIDEDGDGLGDNQSGTEADPSLNDADNDGYTDDVDILPNLASPGDLDNDGILDEEDAFPADFREYKDSDDDGEGDNADVDDDNDGWTDIDEIRQGSDPFSSSVQPVEGFELIIPSTQVSLGAWDIIGILTGVPLAAWIGLGLITRTSRGRRFEASLNEAKSLDELNLIAADYESALMWKMLGPHQGLRLERMRTEIEREKFADQLKSLPVIKKDAKPLIAAPSGTSSAPAESVKESETEIGSPDATIEAQKTDEVGYEWYTDSTGKDFYRPTGSGEDWQEFNG